MTMLAALLLAANVWAVEPGQSVVTVLKGPAIATSLGMTGRVSEMEDGAITADFRVSHFDRRIFDGEVTFEGSAPKTGRDGVHHLKGTLTLGSVTRTVEIPITFVHAGGLIYCHATFAVDGARFEVDAGLRPAPEVATRG